MASYKLSDKELNEARKLIIQDIKSNNHVDTYIRNMTVGKYLDLIKEMVLGWTNEEGKVIDPFGFTCTTRYSIIIKDTDSKTVAEMFMDGRGLFTEHFNGQHHEPNWQDYGTWDNLSWRDENQWYHEDRLNDPNWFKQCVLGSIGAGGHPTESSAGYFTPKYCDGDNWIMMLYPIYHNHYYRLKAYLHLKKLGLPVFLYGGDTYLTPKVINDLKMKGYLDSPDYGTGYGTKEYKE